MADMWTGVRNIMLQKIPVAKLEASLRHYQQPDYLVYCGKFSGLVTVLRPCWKCKIFAAF